LRAQLRSVGGARGAWIVCSLLLGALLLTGCNRTGTSGSATAQSAATGQSAGQSVTPPTNKSADVSWTPPTTNTNGTALTDLAGFRIYYGTSPDALNQTINVPTAGATDYVVQGLTQGTWYFAVVAYTNTGLASALSSLASKTIT
jgi:hypothetical protein